MTSRDTNTRLMGFGSIAAGALMGLGFLMHPVESPDAAVQISAVAADLNRWYVAHVLLLAGLGCLIPSLLLLMRRLAATAPRAALGLGIAAFVGLVSALAFVTIDATVFWALAKPGLDASTVHRVFDDLTKNARLYVVFGPSVLLNVGVFALAVGLFRSKAIPRWTSVALAAAMVVQLLFGFAYIHAAATVAGLLIAVGFIGLGVDAIRRPETVEHGAGMPGVATVVRS